MVGDCAVDRVGGDEHADDHLDSWGGVCGDFGFLQVVIGYMVGRVVVALVFLPKLLPGRDDDGVSADRYAVWAALHKVTAGLFLLTRAAAEGVRVLAVSIVVGIAIGTRDVLSIAIITLLTLAYTFEGGMAAVIWTDVVRWRCTSEGRWWRSSR